MDHLPSALDLARAQFAFVVVWHFLFPAFTIGLASFLAVLEALWLFTRKAVFLDVFHYWLRIFALAFAMGVVSGLVMSYQFGTNWSAFSDKVGPVIGPFLGYEVLTAFFLEAGFLGVMLFGLSRVGPKLHFLATCLVAFGTLISTFWIIAANSWMQTPAGFLRTPDGRFFPTSWVQAIFNPSFPYRYMHVVIAAYLTTALVVGGVGAFHLLKDGTNPRARLMFSMAMWMATIIGPLQMGLGDLQGLNTLQHQPAKIAAMEGSFDTERGARSIIIGWPDAKASQTRYAIAIPKLASLYLTHSLDGEVRGLKAWPRADWPTNIPLVFFAFRTMVGLGLLIVALGLASLIVRLRKRLYETRWLHRWAVAMGPRRSPGGHRRVGDDRGGTSAVYRLRSAPHRRQRRSDGRAGACRFPAGLRGGVLGRVRFRNCLPALPVSPDSSGRRSGSAARPAGANRRHHGRACGRRGAPATRRSGCHRSCGVTSMILDLPVIWALLIAVAVFAYVVMDGFDLGVGILFPLVRGKVERDIMVNSVAPVWDGNETWLGFGRRRPVCGLPTGLRHPSSRALLAADLHAAGFGVSRRIL